MVRIYPHYDDSNGSNRNFITWIGEETPRIICNYCKCTKLERKGRFYYCPQDNISIPISEQVEVPKIDYMVSKLSIDPALVIIDSKRVDKRALNDSKEEIKSRYFKGKIIEDDVKSMLGHSVKVINEWEM